MQLWSFLRYFLYIAWHWNVPLAIVIIRSEWRGEKKYRLNSTGIHTLRRSIPAEDRKHASIYQPVSFIIGEYLLSQLPPAALQAGFLDAGCGKGRAIVMAAQTGFTQLYGFDIAAEMVAVCHQQWQLVKHRYPQAQCRLWQQNAATVQVPDDVGTIFLFNPFDNEVMEPFANQVIASLKRRPRTLYVLYANPQHKLCWLKRGFQSIAHYRRLHYLEGEVFVYRPV
jgi:SAM-dependent methyltransferase